MLNTISTKITAASLTITMTIAFTLGVASFLFTRWNMQLQVTEKLSFEALIFRHRMESVLSTINQEITNMSENLLVVNALIDSTGRDVYIGPFLRGYKLPYTLPFTLTICDFEGTPLLSNVIELPEDEEDSFKSVVEGQHPFAEILTRDNRQDLLIIYPVIYSYTGLAEGTLVLTIPFRAIIDLAFNSIENNSGRILSLQVQGQEIWKNRMDNPLQSQEVRVNLNLAPPLTALALELRLGETEDDLAGPLQELANIYFIVGLAVFFITICLSRFIAHRLTFPLRKLTESIDAVAHTGFPNEPIDITSDDEVQKLTMSFNAMLKKLHESQISLERRVTERTNELVILNKKLQNYADSRNVLLKEVNHRVKNNLTSIISMLHQEEDRLRTAFPGSCSDRGDYIKEVVGRISALLTVHSLLSASQWQPLPLSTLSEKIIQGVCKGVSSEKTMTLEVAHSPVFVSSDQAHYLTIVLNELATNTAKHALSGRKAAHVLVSITTINDSICLLYADDGPGYPDAIMHGETPRNCIGFRLIYGIISRSLQGKVELMNKNGAEVKIIFPRLIEKTEELVNKYD